jgi:hypothetical protein
MLPLELRCTINAIIGSVGLAKYLRGVLISNSEWDKVGLGVSLARPRPQLMPWQMGYQGNSPHHPRPSATNAPPHAADNSRSIPGPCVERLAPQSDVRCSRLVEPFLSYRAVRLGPQREAACDLATALRRVRQGLAARVSFGSANLVSLVDRNSYAAYVDFYQRRDRQ